MIAWAVTLVFPMGVKRMGPYFKRNFCRSDMMIRMLANDARGACSGISGESDARQED